MDGASSFSSVSTSSSPFSSSNEIRDAINPIQEDKEIQNDLKQIKNEQQDVLNSFTKVNTQTKFFDKYLAISSNQRQLYETRG